MRVTGDHDAGMMPKPGRAAAAPVRSSTMAFNCHGASVRSTISARESPASAATSFRYGRRKEMVHLMGESVWRRNGARVELTASPGEESRREVYALPLGTRLRTTRL